MTVVPEALSMSYRTYVRWETRGATVSVVSSPFVRTQTTPHSVVPVPALGLGRSNQRKWASRLGVQKCSGSPDEHSGPSLHRRRKPVRVVRPWSPGWCFNCLCLRRLVLQFLLQFLTLLRCESMNLQSLWPWSPTRLPSSTISKPETRLRSRILNWRRTTKPSRAGKFAAVLFECLNHRNTAKSYFILIRRRPAFLQRPRGS